MKPTPLPPEPKVIDRIEYALQWLVSWVVVDIKDHPAISGLLTGLKMWVPLLALGWLIDYLLKHWK